MSAQRLITLVQTESPQDADDQTSVQPCGSGHAEKDASVDSAAGQEPAGRVLDLIGQLSARHCEPIP